MDNDLNANNNQPTDNSTDDEFPESPSDEIEGFFEDEQEFDDEDLEEENEFAKDDEGSLEKPEDIVTNQNTELEKIDIANIPLQIRLEAGRINVSLEELQQMSPGYKIPLNINPRLIHLTVKGKVIGRGELIEMGDTTGVRVIELFQ